MEVSGANGSPAPAGTFYVERRDGRGLHSSNFRLIVSGFCGPGGAFRGCSEHVWEILGGVVGCAGCNLVSETAQVELKSGRL